MAKPDNLFLLIKAMTKAEKRHFRVDTGKYQSQGNKDYLRLFDAIDKQETYNEVELRDKFKDEPYFSQLKSVKLYLHRQILKSLKNLYDGYSHSIQLNSFLTEIEILYRKELYSNCAHVIKKAKAYAEKHEFFPKLLEIISWELSLALQSKNIEQLELLKSKWFEEERSVLHKYDELAQLKQLEVELTSFVIRKGVAKQKDDKLYLKKMLANPVFQTEMKSFRAEANRLITMAICLRSTDNYEGAFNALCKVIELCDAYPKKIATSLNIYFGNLQGLINVALFMEKFIAAEKYMQKMKTSYIKEQQKLPVRTKIGFLIFETSLLLNRGDFAQSLKIIPGIKELIAEQYKEIDPVGKLLLYFACFDIYFRNRDFKNAHHYLRQVTGSDTGIRADLQCTARIAFLIMQYEEQEYAHLGYAVRSVYRYLLKRQSLHQPEQIILGFLKKVVRLTSEKQLHKTLAELKQQISPFIKEGFMAEFPLILWIDSKLQKKSLAEVTVDRYKKAATKEKAEMLVKRGA